jgi:hypothetical protein
VTLWKVCHVKEASTLTHSSQDNSAHLFSSTNATSHSYELPRVEGKQICKEVWMYFGTKQLFKSRDGVYIQNPWSWRSLLYCLIWCYVHVILIYSSIIVRYRLSEICSLSLLSMKTPLWILTSLLSCSYLSGCQPKLPCGGSWNVLLLFDAILVNITSEG